MQKIFFYEYIIHSISNESYNMVISKNTVERYHSVHIAYKTNSNK